MRYPIGRQDRVGTTATAPAIAASGTPALGRITRYPPKPKPRFDHEVRVGHRGQWNARQGDLWTEVQRIAGPAGFKKRTPFWAFTIVAFDTQEKAAELERWLQVSRFRDEPDRRTSEPDRYELAAQMQYAVLWGLSTGLIGQVVKVYRAERRQCSTHGHPNWLASDVILAAAPAIGRDKARRMVDHMLAWAIEHDGQAFWEGLEGHRQINWRYA